MKTLWNIDMHFHTNFSDGRLDNKQIIEQVSRNWTRFFVATDHDLINTEFPILAKKNWIESCEWVEISILDNIYWYFHITAYAEHFQWKILKVLEQTRNWRRSKIYKQIELLKKNWIIINEDSFFKFFEDKWINTFNLNIYHLASYIYRFQDNIDIITSIAWEEIDKIEFLKRFLRNEWDFAHIGSAMIKEYTPDIRKVIHLVHRNNWILSIAHPNFSFKIDEYKDRIKYFLDLWMDAIEINSRATQEHIEIAKEFTIDWKILTFWSDCHFTPYSEEDHWGFWEVNSNLDSRTIEENLDRLKDKLNIKRRLLI